MPNPQQMVRPDILVTRSMSVRGLPEGHVVVQGENGRIFCMLDVPGCGHTRHIVFSNGQVSEQGEIMNPWDCVNVINPRDVGMKTIVLYRDSQSPAPGV